MTNRKIVADSSANLMKLEKVPFAAAPLKIIAGEREFVDDSQLDLEDKKKSLSSTIEQFWINATSAQVRFASAKAKCKSQEASYALVNEQFQNGLKSVVDVLQSRDNILAAEQDKLQSKYTLLLNIQMLKFYQGEELDL
jgi:outer membrane protein